MGLNSAQILLCALLVDPVMKGLSGSSSFYSFMGRLIIILVHLSVDWSAGPARPICTESDFMNQHASSKRCSKSELCPKADSFHPFIFVSFSFKMQMIESLVEVSANLTAVKA